MTCRRMNLNSRAVLLAALTAGFVTGATPVRAQSDAPASQPGSAAEKSGFGPLNFEADETEVEMKPTEVGVRFTPRMAQGMAKAMAREMRGRYDLSDEQVEQAQEIISRNMMKMAQDTQKKGRDIWELFMENMIANEGAFSKEDAQKWGKLMEDFLPEMKKCMTTTASQIGKTMTLSQRLKLTAEMSAVSAGFIGFEERMKRWSKGEVADMANPFFDGGADRRKSETARDSQTAKESEDVRRARARADRRLDWEVDVESRWSSYVEAAIDYFKLSETQATSARAILKECLERAKAVKTPEWQERLRRNRTAAGMSGKMAKNFREGPWMWQLDREYEELLRPLQDIGKDLRNRVDELAESSQRATAAEQARAQLAKSGLEMPPG